MSETAKRCFTLIHFLVKLKIIEMEAIDLGRYLARRARIQDSDIPVTSTQFNKWTIIL